MNASELGVCEECGNDDATIRLALCSDCLHRLDNPPEEDDQ